ncbi:MAG: cytochrome C [Cyclobacteriaceae bacterium]|nr:cytochrome C [Cyclobacteriaceae bacterium SS2]
MDIKNLSRLVNLLAAITTVLLVLLVMVVLLKFNLLSFPSRDVITEDSNNTPESAQVERIDEEVVDPYTILEADDALPIVVGNCTNCHSARLIAQNRATREGWQDLIRWMQKTQKLWDLGDNEDIILDYLAEYYAPENIGRRRNLENIEWYELK